MDTKVFFFLVEKKIVVFVVKSCRSLFLLGSKSLQQLENCEYKFV